MSCNSLSTDTVMMLAHVAPEGIISFASRKAFKHTCCKILRCHSSTHDFKTRHDVTHAGLLPIFFTAIYGHWLQSLHHAYSQHTKLLVAVVCQLATFRCALHSSRRTFDVQDCFWLKRANFQKIIAPKLATYRTAILSSASTGVVQACFSLQRSYCNTLNCCSMWQ